jgi:hypothetical protein
MNAAHACACQTASLEEARCWIGRNLILRKPLLGFDAGTRCVVMCLVDFGDGWLLWVTTDDKHAVDIDQVSWQELQEYFRLLPANGAQLSLHRMDLEARQDLPINLD